MIQVYQSSFLLLRTQLYFSLEVSRSVEAKPQVLLENFTNKPKNRKSFSFRSFVSPLSDSDWLEGKKKKQKEQGWDISNRISILYISVSLEFVHFHCFGNCQCENHRFQPLQITYSLIQVYCEKKMQTSASYISFTFFK